jgi:putative ABC transport system ATP-binding protein
VSIPSDNPILLARELRPGEDAPAFSLAVGDGEIIALTGTPQDVEASGPLLRRLAGAEAAEGGLWLKGEALHTLRPAARLRFSHAHCAVLPQVTQLLPELSVAENTTMPLLLTGLGRQEARRRALRWLERLDVVVCADWRIPALSPGELRRVAIARALVTEPTVFLAEEPMAGMTAAERFHVMRILRAAAGTHQLTMVIATAYEDVAEWADRRVPLPAAAETPGEDSGTGSRPDEVADDAAPATERSSGISVLSGFHAARHRFGHGGRHRGGDRSGVGVGR